MQPLAYMVYLTGILVLLDGIIGKLVHNLFRYLIYLHEIKIDCFGTFLLSVFECCQFTLVYNWYLYMSLLFYF